MTTVLAWLADQWIALVALGLSCVTLWRERRRVEVTVSPMASASSAGGPSGGMLSVTVANLGRPVTIRSPFIEAVPKGAGGVIGASVRSLDDLLPGAAAFGAAFPRFEPVSLNRRLEKGEAATWVMEVSIQDRSGYDSLKLRASVHVFGGRSSYSGKFTPGAFWPDAPRTAADASDSDTSQPQPS